ncbi:L-threonylcarbamoyladenylate synthase [Cohnella silvisoli]|uniref:Threonylcarbamoyl-AMP synthase n=1 Tax=Cohnella silvisoli TaxID=2873699 RepID=A0ABV1KQG0_9BACL|nr:L-threonylcarbamoyladenylate synthase [Cohnella silvisoli]MCD9022233.1 threonylcarbamoyl-AMP synthase [Cohnella silvisoli]
MTVETKYWPAEQSQAGLKEAAAVLAAGGVIAFPTETVYGLGGDARSSVAVKRIFAAKGRPSDNPLIVHLADREEVHTLAERINDVEQALMSAFWPGPLTLVLPVREGAVSKLVTAGLDTVAVRVPANELARQLIEQSGCPLAAPSANRSGRPSPTQARHVMEDLDGRIDGVLDGGATGVGLESTVVRVLEGKIYILRPGGITREQLQEAVGKTVEVIVAAEDRVQTEAPKMEIAFDSVAGRTEAPRSPGIKYTHYAPKGEMLLVIGQNRDKLIAFVQQQANEATLRGCRVAVLSCTEHVSRYQAEAVFDCGSMTTPIKAAQSLYANLRECDERGLDFIIAEGYPEEGIGAALMNRLRKASGGNEIIV